VDGGAGMSFPAHVMEARRIVGRMGTWPLYAVRDAQDLTEFVGFLRYTTDGHQTEIARLSATLAKKGMPKTERRHAEDRKALLRKWVASWRRATRWVLSLEQEQAAEVAEAALRQVSSEPYYVPCGHPHLTVAETGPRPPSRPPVRTNKRSYAECTACSGLGFR